MGKREGPPPPPHQHHHHPLLEACDVALEVFKLLLNLTLTTRGGR
jgi:hypothetical protein